MESYEERRQNRRYSRPDRQAQRLGYKLIRLNNSDEETRVTQSAA